MVLSAWSSDRERAILNSNSGCPWVSDLQQVSLRKIVAGGGRIMVRIKRREFISLPGGAAVRLVSRGAGAAAGDAGDWLPQQRDDLALRRR